MNPQSNPTIDAYINANPAPGYKAPVAPTEPVAEPTVAQAYSTPEYDNTYDNALNSGSSYYKGISDAPIDENAIRQATLGRFQQEIDATNGVYSQKLREAQMQGQNRIGTTTAINARRGMVGSDMGAADTENTNRYNTNINNSILDEQRAIVAGLTRQANKDASDEITQKKAAKQAGYENYIKFLGESETRKTNRVSNLAKSLVTQGVDLDKLSPGELDQIASKYSTTAGAVKSVYADFKKQADAEQAEAQRKIDVENRDYELKVTIADIDAKYKNGQLTLAEKKQAQDNAVSWYNASTSRSNAITNQYSAETSRMSANTASKKDAAASDPAKAAEQKNEALTLARELRLSTTAGKGSAVGASGAKLIPFGKASGLQGNRAGFEAKLDTLKSNLTFDNLKLLKGAMSDKDLMFLNSIGSSLSVDMSEAQFDKELDRIITKLETATGGSDTTGGEMNQSQNITTAPDGTQVIITD